MWSNVRKGQSGGRARLKAMEGQIGGRKGGARSDDERLALSGLDARTTQRDRERAGESALGSEEEGGNEKERVKEVKEVVNAPIRTKGFGGKRNEEKSDSGRDAGGDLVDFRGGIRERQAAD